MEQREQIIRENFKRLQEVRAGLSGLTQKQIKAVKRATDAIEEMLDYSVEVFEVRLSDLDRLRNALFQLESNFSAEPTDYQRESFAEFGLGEEEVK